MDGLMVYRQYLENIRVSVNNIDLEELKSKEFMGILKRVNQIEDLSYIDVILKNAGLNLSFIHNHEFLDKKVVLESKLNKLFIDTTNMEDGIAEELNEMLSEMIDKEDSVMDKIEELTGENGIKEISIDYFPQSGVSYCTTEELLDEYKDTLSVLFDGLNAFEEALKQEETKTKEIDDVEENSNDSDLGIVEEFFDDEDIETDNGVNSNENLGIDDFEFEKSSEFDFIPETDCNDDLEGLEEIEDKEFSHFSTNEKKVNLSFSLEKEEDNEIEREYNKNIDTSFLDSDSDEEEDVDDEEIVDEWLENEEKSDEIDVSFLNSDSDKEDIEDDRKYDSEYLKRENNKSYFKERPNSEFEKRKRARHYKEFEDVTSNDDDFTDEDLIDEYSDFETMSQKDFSMFLDEEEIRDDTGRVLRDELMDDDEFDENDTDPIERSAFEEATNYFLTGRSHKYDDNDLRNLYKSKNKIVDIDEVSSADDAMAKLLLAFTDGIINLPRVTGDLFRKAKDGSKKMRNTMIVEDDEDEGV